MSFTTIHVVKTFKYSYKVFETSFLLHSSISMQVSNVLNYSSRGKMVKVDHTIMQP